MPKVKEVVVAGQDLAKTRDYSAYVSLIVDTEERAVKIKRIFQWPHVDYTLVQRDTLEFCRLDSVRVLGVDQGKAGEPVIENYLSKKINTKGISFTAQRKNDMINFTRALLQGALNKSPPYLFLPQSGRFVEELKTQMKEQERIVTANAYPKYDSPRGAHDDLLWSLSIALYVSRPYIEGRKNRVPF